MNSQKMQDCNFFHSFESDAILWVNHKPSLLGMYQERELVLCFKCQCNVMTMYSPESELKCEKKNL